MDKTIETNVPNVYVSDLERLAKKIRQVVKEEEAEVSFEFVIASLFPTSWNNIQAELNRQYTLGYLQGRREKEEELQKFIPKTSSYENDDDPDCYCE